MNKYNTARPPEPTLQGITLINISVKDLDGQVHKIQGREDDSLIEAQRQQEWDSTNNLSSSFEWVAEDIV